MLESMTKLCFAVYRSIDLHNSKSVYAQMRAYPHSYSFDAWPFIIPTLQTVYCIPSFLQGFMQAEGKIFLYQTYINQPSCPIMCTM